MIHAPYTIFQDIDGCLLMQDKPTSAKAIDWDEPVVLPGTLAKLVSWAEKGYKLIITTGRKECYREYTVWQLRRAGIAYDQLVMDVGVGPRILVNDNRDEELHGVREPVPKAQAFNVTRNSGIGTLPF